VVLVVLLDIYVYVQSPFEVDWEEEGEEKADKCSLNMTLVS